MRSKLHVLQYATYIPTLTTTQSAMIAAEDARILCQILLRVTQIVQSILMSSKKKACKIALLLLPLLEYY